MWKTKFKLGMKPLKALVNETVDEFLSVLAPFFSSSHEKLFFGVISGNYLYL